MILYHKGNLFDLAPKKANLVHACNCKGVWGSGIAVEFKQRYPIAFKQYESYCDDFGELALGNALVLLGTKKTIICLTTSKSYGINVDSPFEIIRNTRFAILDMPKYITEVWMPKINSGMFKVPWEETEKVLNEYPHITFNVCEL